VWFISYIIHCTINVIISSQALEKQYHPQNYEIQSLQRFKFATNGSSEKPYIGINYKFEGSGWNLGLESFDRVRIIL
jgi:hypothetical protein